MPFSLFDPAPECPVQIVHNFFAICRLLNYLGLFILHFGIPSLGLTLGRLFFLLFDRFGFQLARKGNQKPNVITVLVRLLCYADSETFQETNSAFTPSTLEDTSEPWGVIDRVKVLMDTISTSLCLPSDIPITTSSSPSLITIFLNRLSEVSGAGALPPPCPPRPRPPPLRSSMKEKISFEKLSLHVVNKTHLVLFLCLVHHNCLLGHQTQGSQETPWASWASVQSRSFC